MQAPREILLAVEDAADVSPAPPKMRGELQPAIGDCALATKGVRPYAMIMDYISSMS
jgi:hypothetical protein